VATEYGGAYGGQPGHGGPSSYGGQPGHGGQPSYGGQASSGTRPSSGTPPRPPGRAGKAAVVIALVLGVAGLGVSLAGVATQLLPRQFTVSQQRQIADWEVGSRWRTSEANAIFPAIISYSPPRALVDPSGLPLTARRLGIARQASCAAAADAPVAAVLTRNGCAEMLRATYVDGTGSYVVTVGVAVMPGSAQAAAAEKELPAAGRDAGVHVAGVHAVRFAGTPAAWFTNPRRQLSASVAAGTYVFFYTIGYADERQWVPVAADSYADAEMTSLGQGVARAVDSALTVPAPAPHCPGTPGC
jgi:hypothetical protein